MNNNMKIAYAEVNQILDLLGNEYKNKIPEKIRNLFYEKEDKNYKINISSEKELRNSNISKTALTIISILNLKYWVTNKEEKQKLEDRYKENDKIFNEKINIYKKENWLKQRNETIKEEVVEETSLINIQEEGFLLKIKNFLKKIFNKKKVRK